MTAPTTRKLTRCSLQRQRKYTPLPSILSGLKRSTAAIAAIVGLQMLVGFIIGVVVTLFAAALAGTDFE